MSKNIVLFLLNRKQLCIFAACLSLFHMATSVVVSNCDAKIEQFVLKNKNKNGKVERSVLFRRIQNKKKGYE
jgi:hypothetical protein